MWSCIDREFTRPENFSKGFENKTFWFTLSLDQWLYWWWFWFGFLWMFYFMLTVHLLEKRQFKFHSKINTSLRSHSKWGDFFVSVIPLIWCFNIIWHSNLMLRNFENQQNATAFTLKIIGRQWYWVYKYDMDFFSKEYNKKFDIGNNKWVDYCKPLDSALFNLEVQRVAKLGGWRENYSNLLFSNLVEETDGYLFNDSFFFYKFYNFQDKLKNLNFFFLKKKNKFKFILDLPSGVFNYLSRLGIGLTFGKYNFRFFFKNFFFLEYGVFFPFLKMSIFKVFLEENFFFYKKSYKIVKNYDKFKSKIEETDGYLFNDSFFFYKFYNFQDKLKNLNFFFFKKKNKFKFILDLPSGVFNYLSRLGIGLTFGKYNFRFFFKNFFFLEYGVFFPFLKMSIFKVFLEESFFFYKKSYKIVKNYDKFKSKIYFKSTLDINYIVWTRLFSYNIYFDFYRELCPYVYGGESCYFDEDYYFDENFGCPFGEISGADILYMSNTVDRDAVIEILKSAPNREEGVMRAFFELFGKNFKSFESFVFYYRVTNPTIKQYMRKTPVFSEEATKNYMFFFFLKYLYNRNLVYGGGFLRFRKIFFKFGSRRFVNFISELFKYKYDLSNYRFVNFFYYFFFRKNACFFKKYVFLLKRLEAGRIRYKSAFFSFIVFPYLTNRNFFPKLKFNFFFKKFLNVKFNFFFKETNRFFFNFLFLNSFNDLVLKLKFKFFNKLFITHYCGKFFFKSKFLRFYLKREVGFFFFKFRNRQFVSLVFELSKFKYNLFNRRFVNFFKKLEFLLKRLRVEKTEREFVVFSFIVFFKSKFLKFYLKREVGFFFFKLRNRQLVNLVFELSKFKYNLFNRRFVNFFKKFEFLLKKLRVEKTEREFVVFSFIVFPYLVNRSFFSKLKFNFFFKETNKFFFNFLFLSFFNDLVLKLKFKFFNKLFITHYCGKFFFKSKFLRFYLKREVGFFFFKFRNRQFVNLVFELSKFKYNLFNRRFVNFFKKLEFLLKKLRVEKIEREFAVFSFIVFFKSKFLKFYLKREVGFFFFKFRNRQFVNLVFELSKFKYNLFNRRFVNFFKKLEFLLKKLRVEKTEREFVVFSFIVFPYLVNRSFFSKLKFNFFFKETNKFFFNFLFLSFFNDLVLKLKFKFFNKLFITHYCGKFFFKSKFLKFYLKREVGFFFFKFRNRQLVNLVFELSRFKYNLFNCRFVNFFKKLEFLLKKLRVEKTEREFVVFSFIVFPYLVNRSFFSKLKFNFFFKETNKFFFNFLFLSFFNDLVLKLKFKFFNKLFITHYCGRFFFKSKFLKFYLKREVGFFFFKFRSGQLVNLVFELSKFKYNLFNRRFVNFFKKLEFLLKKLRMEKTEREFAVFSFIVFPYLVNRNFFSKLEFNFFFKETNKFFFNFLFLNFFNDLVLKLKFKFFNKLFITHCCGKFFFKSRFLKFYLKRKVGVFFLKFPFFYKKRWAYVFFYANVRFLMRSFNVFFLYKNFKKSDFDIKFFFLRNFFVAKVGFFNKINYFDNRIRFFGADVASILDSKFLFKKHTGVYLNLKLDKCGYFFYIKNKRIVNYFSFYKKMFSYSYSFFFIKNYEVIYYNNKIVNWKYVPNFDLFSSFFFSISREFVLRRFFFKLKYNFFNFDWFLRKKFNISFYWFKYFSFYGFFLKNRKNLFYSFYLKFFLFKRVKCGVIVNKLKDNAGFRWGYDCGSYSSFFLKKIVKNKILYIRSQYDFWVEQKLEYRLFMLDYFSEDLFSVLNSFISNLYKYNIFFFCKMGEELPSYLELDIIDDWWDVSTRVFTLFEDGGVPGLFFFFANSEYTILDFNVFLNPSLLKQFSFLRNFIFNDKITNSCSKYFFSLKLLPFKIFTLSSIGEVLNLQVFLESDFLREKDISDFTYYTIIQKRQIPLRDLSYVIYDSFYYDQLRKCEQIIAEKRKLKGLVDSGKLTNVDESLYEPSKVTFYADQNLWLLENNEKFISSKINKLLSFQKLRSKKTPQHLEDRLLLVDEILLLPLNTNIRLMTSSYDVVHSWFIPGLGMKFDCVPGKCTHHSLRIDTPGFYYGQCAEICGRFHHHMPIRICVVPIEHFVLWWREFSIQRNLAHKDKLEKNFKEDIKMRVYRW